MYMGRSLSGQIFSSKLAAKWNINLTPRTIRKSNECAMLFSVNPNYFTYARFTSKAAVIDQKCNLKYYIL